MFFLSFDANVVVLLDGLASRHGELDGGYHWLRVAVGEHGE